MSFLVEVSGEGVVGVPAHLGGQTELIKFLTIGERCAKEEGQEYIFHRRNVPFIAVQINGVHPGNAG